VISQMKTILNKISDEEIVEAVRESETKDKGNF
jgi:hypothetical protein